MKTIYETKGAAKEYCELAVDIYENCPHKCSYCYAKAKVERKNKEFVFEGARANLLENLENELKANPNGVGDMIFLGFSSDPFPYDNDCSATLDVIKLLKSYGRKIMLCTKGGLTSDVVRNAIRLVDSVGITLSCSDDMAKTYEPYAATPEKRLELLNFAHECGCETWISFEPVLETNYIVDLIKSGRIAYVDVVKLGKLNHMDLSDLTGNPDDIIDWHNYYNEVVSACESVGMKYMVKKALLHFKTEE